MMGAWSTPCILSFAALFAFTKAASVYELIACPTPKLCPNATDSVTCVSVEQFFQEMIGVCPGCGTCVEPDATLDSDGCPLRTCEIPSASNECDYFKRHKQFIIYNSMLCPDCDAFSCHVHSPDTVFADSAISQDGDVDIGIGGEEGFFGPGK